MSSVSSPLGPALPQDAPDPNAASRGERASAPPQDNDPNTTGWDAYDVWRRFIKDVRQRRQQQD